MRNVEALARWEDENEKKGYALIVDAASPCTITHNGNTERGFYATCEKNAGDLVSCASGCLREADLH